MKTKINTLAKTLIACFVMVSVSQILNAQMSLENITPPLAIIDFEAETVDYGVIEQDSNGERTISFTNTGDAPLIITSIKSSCGCTVPSFSKTPVLPNQSGEIVVKYNTAKVGAFSKTITVISNATEASKKIKIKGTVTKK